MLGVKNWIFSELSALPLQNINIGGPAAYDLDNKRYFGAKKMLCHAFLTLKMK